MIVGTIKDLYPKFQLENIEITEHEFYAIVSLMERTGQARVIGERETADKFGRGRKPKIFEINEKAIFNLALNS